MSIFKDRSGADYSQRKFFSNLLALFSGTASQLAIQLLTIPILISAKGIQDTAIWLLAYNFSQFTSILDFGISSSIQNSSLNLLAKKRTKQIDEQLSQLSLLIIVSNSGFLILAYIFNKYIFHNLDFSLITIFVISNFLQFLLSYLEILARLNDRTAWGLYTSNVVRIIEFCTVLVCLQIFRTSLFFSALAGVILKFVIIIGMQKFFPEKFKFLRISYFKFNLFYLNLKQGFPFLLNRASDLILLNLVVVVAQNRMETGELVLFLAARTFFRFALQINAVFSHSYGYEMTKSWSNGDLELMKVITVRSTITTVSISCIGSLLYFALGPYFFGIWTDQNLSISTTLLLVGIGYSFILSLNQNQKTKFNSINLNFQVSIVQILLASIYILSLALYFDAFSALTLLTLSIVFELLSFFLTAITMHGQVKAHFQNGK